MPNRPTSRPERPRFDGLVALGIAVMAADFAYSQYSGELFSVGPVRPLWVAGPLVIAGIALALVRFVQNAR